MEDNESESSLLKEQIKSLREENIGFTNQIKAIQKEYKYIESQLIEAKMHWAELDMENDQLAFNLKKKSDQLKIFSSQLTQLEIELVKTKQELGEALNTVNEYEMS